MKIKVVIPGTETEEGRKRIKKAMDDRDYVDYQCTMILRRILGDLRTDLMYDCPSTGDLAGQLLSEAEELLEKRSRLDDEVVRAAAGMPVR